MNFNDIKNKVVESVVQPLGSSIMQAVVKAEASVGLSEQVSQAIADFRMSICNGCDTFHKESQYCQKSLGGCGCFMPEKSKIRYFTNAVGSKEYVICPKSKWMIAYPNISVEQYVSLHKHVSGPVPTIVPNASVSVNKVSVPSSSSVAPVLSPPVSPSVPSSPSVVSDSASTVSGSESKDCGCGKKS